MKGKMMKVIVEVSREDEISYSAEIDEIKDWFEQALRHSIDTWDGGLVFLDGVQLEIKRV